MNILPTSVEGWYVIFQTLSVVFIMLTVGTGAGTIITGYIANRRQTATIATANAEAGKANKGVTDANLEIAKAKEGTARALSDAANASERAQKLEGQNIQLRTDLETATAESRAKQAELAKEQAKLSSEQRKTAEAQRQAFEAQRALAEVVERRTAPRRLSAQQKLSFVEELKKHPVSDITLGCAVGSEESCNFAHEFLELFRLAGWKVAQGDVVRGQLKTPLAGIAIFIPSTEVVPTPDPNVSWFKIEPEFVERLATLRGALAAINVDAQVLRDSGKEPSAGISLFFGSKL